jgi:carboxylesterase type B
VNYRTNVFGFPSAPELGAKEHNLGFYDQRAGLEWVQRNIHVFGGSPKKVTIFGESAGAVSVDALITSEKPGTPLFRAAIMQSGQISVSAPPNNTLITAAWTSLASALGCPSGKGSLKCMKGKSATAIESVVSHSALSFGPTFDNVTYVSDREEARVKHQIANVPVLIGNDDQEGMFKDPTLLQSFGGSTENPQVVSL